MLMSPDLHAVTYIIILFRYTDKPKPKPVIIVFILVFLHPPFPPLYNASLMVTLLAMGVKGKVRSSN